MYDWWWDGSMDNKDGVKQIYITKKNFVNDMSKEIEGITVKKNLKKYERNLYKNATWLIIGV